MVTTRTSDHGDARLIVGKRNRTRLQILMVCVALAFILANVTSYLIGHNATTAAARRTDARVSALEQQVRQELDARRAARDAEHARRDATTVKFRGDACILANRIHPRDQAVQEFRRRWGCTTTPTR